MKASAAAADPAAVDAPLVARVGPAVRDLERWSRVRSVGPAGVLDAVAVPGPAAGLSGRGPRRPPQSPAGEPRRDGRPDVAAPKKESSPGASPCTPNRE